MEVNLSEQVAIWSGEDDGASEVWGRHLHFAVSASGLTKTFLLSYSMIIFFFKVGILFWLAILLAPGGCEEKHSFRGIQMGVDVILRKWWKAMGNVKKALGV